MNKIKGYFEIVDKNGVVVRRAKNHITDLGARYLLSVMRGTLIADGYGSASAKPTYIHVGTGQGAFDKTAYKLESPYSSVAISSTAFITTIKARFSATWTTTGIAIGELALGLDSTMASAPTQYNKTMVDRAVVTPPYTPGGTITINYYMEMVWT